MMLHVALVIFIRSVFQDRVSIAESMIVYVVLQWDTLVTVHWLRWSRPIEILFI